MAATSIWAVKSRLDKVINYAENPEKTAARESDLDSVLGYAMNVSKTEKMLFVTGVNCDPTIAREEMNLTKKAWNKEGGILAFHGYQSFKPSETTPEQAHEIGVAFARRMWGERFQVVVATHLDRAHLHNHFVVNSVSFRDGKRYYDNKKSYYGSIRKISDALCKENGLSIIAPKGNGKHYSEWADEKAGKPTIRKMIQADVDDVIRQSYTFKTFVAGLQKRGYVVKYGSNVKYMAVKPKGGERFICLKSLGEDYTEDAIRERLIRLRDEPKETTPEFMPECRSSAKCYRFIGSLPRKPRSKLRGFTALYFKYLYLLGKTKRRKLPYRAAFLLRDDLIKFDRYQKQFRFLYENHIETPDGLATFQSAIKMQMTDLVAQREPLYAERRNAPDEKTVSLLSEQISEITSNLRTLRMEIGLCERIRNDIPDIQVKIEQVQAIRNEKEESKSKSPSPYFKSH